MDLQLTGKMAVVTGSRPVNCVLQDAPPPSRDFSPS